MPFGANNESFTTKSSGATLKRTHCKGTPICLRANKSSSPQRPKFEMITAHVMHFIEWCTFFLFLPSNHGTRDLFLSFLAFECGTFVEQNSPTDGSEPPTQDRPLHEPVALRLRPAGLASASEAWRCPADPSISLTAQQCTWRWRPLLRARFREGHLFVPSNVSLMRYREWRGSH